MNEKMKERSAGRTGEVPALLLCAEDAATRGGNPPQVESVSDLVNTIATTIALEGQPLLIPIPKAARLLGISRSAAYRCAASGDLPTRHLGGRVYIVTAKLREFLESA